MISISISLPTSGIHGYIPTWVDADQWIVAMAMMIAPCATGCSSLPSSVRDILRSRQSQSLYVLGRPRPAKPDELLPMTNGSDASTHTLSIPRHVLALHTRRFPVLLVYFTYTTPVKDPIHMPQGRAGRTGLGTVDTPSLLGRRRFWCPRPQPSFTFDGSWAGNGLRMGLAVELAPVVKVLTVFTSRPSRYRRRSPGPAPGTGPSPPHRQLPTRWLAST